jgi:hypothetical protein
MTKSNKTASDRTTAEFTQAQNVSLSLYREQIYLPDEPSKLYAGGSLFVYRRGNRLSQC